MIFFVLISIVFLGMLTLYLALNVQPRLLFDKVTIGFLVFITWHACLIIIVLKFFPNKLYLDNAFPFGLLYGPFLYFGLKAMISTSFQRKTLFFHALPFLIGLCFYLVYIFAPGFRDSYQKIYFVTVYSIIILSMFIYAVLVYFLMDRKEIRFREIKRVLVSAMVWLFLVACFFASIVYSRLIPNNTDNVFVTKMVVYLTMLGVVGLVFKHYVNRLVKKNKTEITVEAEKTYKKSTVSEEMFDDYEVMLTDIIERRQIFLEKDLSLNSLARELKIPTHHLTQLFSMRIQKNFNQYINSYRVMYACTLLKENAPLTIEDLAQESGFNSKTSFNRHFKLLTGYTPSEYQQLWT